jgi:2,5-dioxopentanoate dehydrogenase
MEIRVAEHFWIGSERRTSSETFTARAAANGEALPGAYSVSTPADVAEACALAEAAFDAYRETTPAARAAFLETIAVRLEARSGELVARAIVESGLPQPRLAGELGRTCGQLRLFATLLREGHWAEATLEAALPERQPLPRPDLRLRQIAVGPVAVFGASNFPLAFSVAGGDTASALAAGCPVVARAHPAHPGASLAAADAIAEAVAQCGMPAGTFSLIQGPDHALGAALVADPRIAAVGFTGSRAGGLALIGIAQARAVPIPVYAEMSSVNPVILFPSKLAESAAALAQAYVGSLSLGAGQFCTNPGIVLALEGPDLDTFVETAGSALAQVPAQTMLHGGIAAAYRAGLAKIDGTGAACVARGAEGSDATGAAALYSVGADEFGANPALAHENFGPSSIVVRCPDIATLRGVLAELEGQLTATLHLNDIDVPLAQTLLPLLERKAGRILVNGWPTGVEVCRTMVHGGPFPATSDPRTTSVGAKAIERFLRPVCYQAFPDALLPDALKEANPLDLPRRTFA